MKKMNFILTSILISFLITGAYGLIAVQTNQAHALMVELGLEDLTGESDFILRGEIAEVKSEWNEDRTLIHTYITLSVKERIHGQGAAETITIKQRGGEVDGIRMAVSNCAIFKPGEDVVVFLKPDSTPQAARLQQMRGRVVTQIVGKEQCKYTVAEDQATRAEAVIVNRAVLATREGAIVTRPGKRIPLEEFVGDIKRIKAGQR